MEVFIVVTNYCKINGFTRTTISLYSNVTIYYCMLNYYIDCDSLIVESKIVSLPENKYPPILTGLTDNIACGFLIPVVIGNY